MAAGSSGMSAPPPGVEDWLAACSLREIAIGDFERRLPAAQRLGERRIAIGRRCPGGVDADGSWSPIVRPRRVASCGIAVGLFELSRQERRMEPLLAGRRGRIRFVGSWVRSSRVLVGGSARGLS